MGNYETNPIRGLIPCDQVARRNKANPVAGQGWNTFGLRRVSALGEQSQSEISSDMPTGISHQFECSAGQMGILVKWLILFGELVVTQRPISPEIGVHG